MIQKLSNPKLTLESFKHFYLLLILVFGISESTNAQITYTWTGSSSRVWNNTTNWSKTSGTNYLGTSATDIVVVPTVTNQPRLGAVLSATIPSFTI
ncbi:hypothetical protein [Flavobacterium sp. N1994]|uniref:hypothetical protein n=1 Tax=Flavobacterium sp. N1994 TaxID=2986827 RepID=UPI00222183E9|nr:hypothetical protein [Flavobacterium sp. N1994]